MPIQTTHLIATALAVVALATCGTGLHRDTIANLEALYIGAD